MIKTISLIVLSLLLMGSIFIGCADYYAPTNSDELSSANAQQSERTLMKPPSNSGKVLRYNDAFLFYARDYANGYTLWLAVPDYFEYCAGVDNQEEMDFKDIYLPNTDPGVADRIVQSIKGDNISAFIWDWSDGTTQGCAYYTNTEPAASGFVKVRITDNDFEMWADPDRKNANSVNWSANGPMVGPDGQLFNLNMSLHYGWKWAWPADGSKDNFHLKIKLTPKG